MSRGIGFDRAITIFNPEGRLFQIEYAFKAAKASGLTATGVRGNSAVAICIEKKVPDRFVVPSSVTRLFNVCDTTGVCTVGHLPDGQNVKARLQQESAKFRHKYGYIMPAGALACRLGDLAQVYTQHAFMRAYGVLTLIGSIDEEKGPQLYKVDPAGMYQGFKCVAAGLKEQEAMNFLEKEYKKTNGDLNDIQTIQLAIESLQNVLGEDFKSRDIEVGFISTTDRKFRKLTEAEIDEHLNAIADKD